MGKSKFVKVVEKKKPNRLEYSVNVSDSKKKDKFIKKVERLIRSSMEYRDYIAYLRENVDMDACAFFSMVSSNSRENPDNKKVKIEIHHEPFTLYDYVSVVLEKYLHEGIPVDDMDIADEVMNIHYANLVGLIPLSKTMHQVVHRTQAVPIPIYMCYGSYIDFIRDYEPYITDNMLDKLERKMKETSQITEETFDAIRKQFEYLDIEGVDDIAHVEIEGENIAAA